MKKYYINNNNYSGEQYRRTVNDIEDLGEVGTGEYNQNVKRYFNLGDLDIDKLADMPDQQKAYNIFADYVNREESINSGEYLKYRMNTALDNFEKFLNETLLPDDTEFSNNLKDSIMSRVSGNKSKKLSVLRDLANIMRDYYTVMKALSRNNMYDEMENETDATIDRIRDLLDDWGL